MPLWQLEPVDPMDPSGEASAYRGKVIIRARNEMTARVMAEKAFGVKTRFPPKKGIIVPPWKRPDLVKAKMLDAALYDPKGPSQVLNPPQG